MKALTSAAKGEKENKGSQRNLLYKLSGREKETCGDNEGQAGYYTDCTGTSILRQEERSY